MRLHRMPLRFQKPDRAAVSIFAEYDPFADFPSFVLIDYVPYPYVRELELVTAVLPRAHSSECELVIVHELEMVVAILPRMRASACEIVIDNVRRLQVRELEQFIAVPSSECQLVACGMFVLAFIYICRIVIAELYVIK